MKTLTIKHGSKYFLAHVWLDGTVQIESVSPNRAPIPVVDPPPEVIAVIDRLYATHDDLVSEDGE